MVIVFSVLLTVYRKRSQLFKLPSQFEGGFEPKYTLARETQPENAIDSIILALSNFIAARETQPEKALMPIDSTSGRLIFARAVQSEKALIPTFFTKGR